MVLPYKKFEFIDNTSNKNDLLNVYSDNICIV